MILHNSNNVNGPARCIQITGCGWGEINISSLPCCLSTRSRARYQVRTCNFINFITQTRSLLDVIIQHIAPLFVCTGLHFGCSGSTRELPSQPQQRSAPPGKAGNVWLGAFVLGSPTAWEAVICAA